MIPSSDARAATLGVFPPARDERALSAAASEHGRTMRAALVATLTLALGSAVLAAPREAAAQKKGASDPKVAEAKRLFEEGRALYQKGRYEEAIEAFEIAFELSKRPLLHDSIASAYERLGNFKKARESLGKWREAAPEKEHAVLDERLKNLDERIRKEDDERKAAEAAKKAPPPPAAPPAEPRASLLVPGLVVGGVGLGAVVAGVVVGAAGVGSFPDTSTQCRVSEGKTLCPSTTRSSFGDAGTLTTVGDVVWVAGAVVAAAGVTLVLVDRVTHQPSAARVTLSPLLGQGLGGASVRLRF